MTDLVFTGGLLVDGTGAAPRRAGSDHHAGHGAGFRRLDLVEGLHRLDQQQGLSFHHLLAEQDRLGQQVDLQSPGLLGETGDQAF